MRTVFESLINHPGLDPQIKTSLDQAEIINANNVADFYFSSKSDEDWKMTDFPNVAPPFKSFFVEFSTPNYCLMNKMEVKNPYQGSRFGFLFLAYDKKESATATIEKKLGMGSSNARWVMVALSFIEQKGKLITIDGDPMFTGYGIQVADNGEIYENIASGDCGLHLIASEDYFLSRESELQKEMRDGNHPFRSAFEVALLAISFMHCKNVKALPVLPKKSPGKRNKHGPRVTYHVLEIAPMKKILQTEGNSEKTGLKKALHICRGHFKTFEKHGLFGKYTGTYWWDAHTRGNISAGITEKDYSINLETGAPKGAA